MVEEAPSLPVDPRVVALRAALAEQYEFLSLLGEGGFANVYAARNLQLGRVEAFKVLLHAPGGRDTAEFAARFEQEARIVASLDHPHIVKLFDFGTAAGIPWFSMQFIQGASLVDKIGLYSPMPESMAVGILLPVLDALEYAHRRGIVHRDIKPGNILFDADGRPYVADFGLAKPKDAPSVTRTNVVMGTPHYLAPEQARGKVLDHRSDIYALSATLYEMLTGARPFSSVDGLEAVIAKLESDPEPARTLRPDLSPALDLALRRGMARKPEDRFQSAAEMAAALARALEFPDEGAPVPEPERHEAEGLFDRVPVVPSTTLEKPRSVQDTYQTEVLVDVLHPAEAPALPAAPELPNSGAKALILTVTGVVLAAAVLAFAFLRGPGEFREAVPEVVPANPSSVTPSTSREGGGNDSIPSATDVIPSPAPPASATLVPATTVPATQRPSPRADAVPPSKPLARPVVPPNQATDGDQEILAGMPDGCAGVQVAAVVTIDANGAVKGARSLSNDKAECWNVAEKFIRSIRFEPARASDGTAVESAPLAISVSLGDKKP